MATTVKLIKEKDLNVPPPACSTSAEFPSKCPRQKSSH